MKIKIGDAVMWRGSWGTNAPEEAKVVSIELCQYAGQKEGTPVEEVCENDLTRAVFDLDNGHWAYGDQITKEVCND